MRDLKKQDFSLHCTVRCSLLTPTVFQFCFRTCTKLVKHLEDGEINPILFLYKRIKSPTIISGMRCLVLAVAKTIQIQQPVERAGLQSWSKTVKDDSPRPPPVLRTLSWPSVAWIFYLSDVTSLLLCRDQTTLSSILALLIKQSE